MSDPTTSLTERQRFWLEHIRACGNGSLKAYAEANNTTLTEAATAAILKLKK